VATFIVSAPTTRLGQKEKIITKALRETSEEFSERLGFTRDHGRVGPRFSKETA
jgi:hypothetical protein